MLFALTFNRIYDLRASGYNTNRTTDESADVIAEGRAYYGCTERNPWQKRECHGCNHHAHILGFVIRGFNRTCRSRVLDLRIEGFLRHRHDAISGTWQHSLIPLIFGHGRQWGGARVCYGRAGVDDSLSIAFLRLSPTIVQAFDWSSTAVTGANDFRSTLRVAAIRMPFVIPLRTGLLLIAHRPYLSDYLHTIRQTLRCQVVRREMI